MDSLIVAFNVVFPLFIMLSLGYYLRTSKKFDGVFFDKVNSLCFKIFVPLLVFYNIYSADNIGDFNVWAGLYGGVGVFLTFLAAMFIIPKIEKNPHSIAAMVQGIARSNYVLYGIPICANIFGAENIYFSVIMAVIVVPVYNVMSVIVLEIYREGKINVLAIIKGIFKNPIIQGSIIGIACYLIGVKLPSAVESSISSLVGVATPLALVGLGGAFEFSKISGNVRNLIIGVVGKIILMPGVFVILAAILGFRGVELATFMVIFGAPTAVSSYSMAQNMGADHVLAGQIVVFSTFFSIATIFMWVAVFTQFGFF